MADDLHSFITVALLNRLKGDVEKFYAANRPELVASAYYHARRLLLVQPGWSCRVTAAPAGTAPDLVLYNRDVCRAAIQLEFAAGRPDFHASLFEDRMQMLRQAVATAGPIGSVRGYLIAAFDAAQSSLYPNEAEPERQTCFWLPVNCRDFSNYAEWRSRWNKLAAR